MKKLISMILALVLVLGCASVVSAEGEITKALTVRVDKVSPAAKAKIEAAGGKVEPLC